MDPYAYECVRVISIYPFLSIITEIWYTLGTLVRENFVKTFGNLIFLLGSLLYKSFVHLSLVV